MYVKDVGTTGYAGLVAVTPPPDVEVVDEVVLPPPVVPPLPPEPPEPPDPVVVVGEGLTEGDVDGEGLTEGDVDGEGLTEGDVDGEGLTEGDGSNALYSRGISFNAPDFDVAISVTLPSAVGLMKKE